MPNNSFETIISSLGLSYYPGLQALSKPDKKRVTAQDTEKLSGSVPLDEDLKKSFPEDNRWDYVVAYDPERRESLYFIEIHPASSSDIKTVVAKKKWLDRWLAASGKVLKDYSSHVKYYWISTGKIKFHTNLKPGDNKFHAQIVALKKYNIEGPVTQLKIK
ncbi:MAG: hypothetical protein Q4A17_14150 [Thermoguttaceae bacterium]|nr:hypothetical protein [Thermoguttaceae bacterium]